MRFLLDTHALLWMASDDEKLSARARILITKSSVVVSVISLFEIAVKVKIGKLPFYRDLPSFWNSLSIQGIEVLPVSAAHLNEYTRLPLLENHRDPFDRLLIATAKAEGMGIITADKKFSLYGDMVSIIW